MNNLYRIITFLLIISIAACTSTRSNMSAANDEDKDIGLGGTGLLANTGNGAGSGLGGTGIVGAITGFGSIFVNGIEVEYNNKTAFTIDGKPATHQQLEIGDIVEVLTTDTNKHTQARLINLRHEVIGQVESVEPETFSFTVQGQSIIQAINKVVLPEIGVTVAVSGFRIDEKTILSTKVKPADAEQTLVRTFNELPFKGKTTRWLVQTYINNSKAIFQLDGIAYVLTVEEKTQESFKDRLGIKILQLQKPVSGKLELDRVIKTMDMPRGRRTSAPVQRPGNKMMQRPASGPMSGPGNVYKQPKMHQGKR